MTDTVEVTSPRWDSQPYPAEGASAAEGIRSQLGRPELDLLTVLVREAAQNSWDARTKQPGSNVRFSLELRSVGPAHANAWRKYLLEGGPRTSEDFPLRTSLASGTIRILVVSDRGTKGLGGPTRADVVADGERDFVSFVRNVGEPRDTELGGGTYGFGKGIFFMLSRPHAVLIYTRTEYAGRSQTRLIGSCLAHSYTESLDSVDTRYTGRHWWGTRVRGVVEPLVDDAADAMADRLGLRRFGPDETGTTIVVIDPEIEEILEDPEEVGPYLAETVMWQLWPKMLPRSDGEPTMTFDVTVDGRPYEVPDPSTTLPISLFVEAHRRLNGVESREVVRKSPRRLLGHLGLNDTLVPRWPVTRAAESAGFTTNLVHHICLMRNAELVVKYYALVEPTAEFKGYAGVFRADPSLDDIFAKSEPPTHDAWNPNSLPESERSYVRVVFTRLREIQQELNGLHVSVKSQSDGVALGAASNYFSRLVRQSPGTGGRMAPFEAALQGGTGGVGAGDSGATPRGRHRMPDAPGTGFRARVRIDYVGEPSIRMLDGEPALVQAFRLPAAAGIRLRADVAIATAIDAQGREAGSDTDRRVIGWVAPDGHIARSVSPTVDSNGEGVWQVLVARSLDSMSAIDIRAEVQQ